MFTTYTQEYLQSKNDNQQAQIEVHEDELVNEYQLEECVKWIRQHKFERTCLQFPENLLNNSTSIALYLQNALNTVVYILADTSYGSCCVDEVAAEHVKGDSIIHFGHACLSPVLQLPVFYVFNKQKLNLQKFVSECETLVSDDKPLLIFYDDEFYHLYKEFCRAFEQKKNVCVSKLDVDHENLCMNNNERIMCGRVFIHYSSSNVTALYLGDESVTLINLVLALPEIKWYRYTKEDKVVEFSLNRSKFLMQRMHLVEKIKEAKVIGILIGTLGIVNYLQALDRIKALVKKSGKKCYKLAVGKPNVAKLANFPEIDVFVSISCQENSLLKDYKEYYKPIVSLFEVEMALGDRPYGISYTSDFRELLPNGSFFVDVKCEEGFEASNKNTCQEILEKSSGAIIESSGAQFLSNRTWRGLKQNIGKTEVCAAVKGRVGIPQGYENEMKTLSDVKPS